MSLENQKQIDFSTRLKEGEVIEKMCAKKSKQFVWNDTLYAI